MLDCEGKSFGNAVPFRTNKGEVRTAVVKFDINTVN
jgi:hypothetical protein